MKGERKRTPANPLEDLVDKNCNDKKKRKVLLVELNSIAPFIPNYVKGLAIEKERKRSLAKVKTNALRLLEALSELDQDAYDFSGGHLFAGDPTDRGAQLRSLEPMHALVSACEAISALDVNKLPAQSLKVRPEMLIASGIVAALRRAGIDPSEADTGFAADCFREITRQARVSATDTPKYWLNRAKKTPEI